MNPLTSLCPERSCYENGSCRPIYVEAHLSRSYLFWVQVFVTLTTALPLKTSSTDYSRAMAVISSQQAGMRSAEQLDLAGIFRHLNDRYKDVRPSNQSVMDQDMYVICGSHQTKLRRDFEVILDLLGIFIMNNTQKLHFIQVPKINMNF